MENCNDTIGNRTRGLQACSAIPQPTAPPRAPVDNKYLIIYSTSTFSNRPKIEGSMLQNQ
jgi:hypothetical protein